MMSLLSPTAAAHTEAATQRNPSLSVSLSSPDFRIQHCTQPFFNFVECESIIYSSINENLVKVVCTVGKDHTMRTKIPLWSCRE